jgi:hypothetical protein
MLYIHAEGKKRPRALLKNNFGRASDRRPTSSIPAVLEGSSSGWACQAVRARSKSCPRRSSAAASSHRRPGRFRPCQSPRRGADRGAH